MENGVEVRSREMVSKGNSQGKCKSKRTNKRKSKRTGSGGRMRHSMCRDGGGVQGWG